MNRSQAPDSPHQVAGRLFEILRRRGETIEEAMRQADRVLRARRRMVRRTAVQVSTIQPVAHELLAVIALDNGTTLDDLRRHPKTFASSLRIRTEAVWLVREICKGLPSFPELGKFFGRHHASLIKANTALVEEMRTNELLRARLEKWLADRGHVRKVAA